MKYRNWHWLSHHRNKYFYDDIKPNPCVYAIYAYLDTYYGNKKIVYIGKAKNLATRLSGHGIEKMLYDNDISTACKFRYCEDPAQLEMELIKKIKPIFNTQHNKEFVQSIYKKHMLDEIKMEIQKNAI